MTIEEVSADYLNGFRSNPAEMIEVGNKVYSIGGNGWEGFIVGGIILTAEDDVWAGPSSLMPQ